MSEVKKVSYELWEAWRLVADKQREAVASLAFTSVAKTSQESVAAHLSEEELKKLSSLV
jgi:hypothetical protein